MLDAKTRFDFKSKYLWITRPIRRTKALAQSAGKALQVFKNKTPDDVGKLMSSNDSKGQGWVILTGFHEVLQRACGQQTAVS